MAENLEVASPALASATPGLKSLARSHANLLLVCSIALLALAGCLGIYHELAVLWVVWTSDPLRSIGILIPPVSVLLTLLVWRDCDWQMRGTWWGLPVIALSYLLSLMRQKLLLLAVLREVSISFIPISLPVYVYFSGIVLLFAGTKVWRKAWFPIGLLLLSQPVPILANGLIDIPLQNLSAQVARGFATLIHFAPTTPQLRLMFSPDFGMFIAPGCDGIRGAVSMGYVALILGYIQRVSLRMWGAYVAGAILLGYLFNFVRLCALVVYYRIALGHPALEDVAKQADYVIGSCLFLVATFLFLRLAGRRSTSGAKARSVESNEDNAASLPVESSAWLRCGALAITLAFVLALPSSALNFSRNGVTPPESFAARMPKRVGNFTLTRTWYEQSGGTPVVQAGAYSSPQSDEIILGIWIAPLYSIHDASSCWLARGLKPDLLTDRVYRVAGGNAVNLKTGFYHDGVTDSVVVNGICTPQSCSQFLGDTSKSRFGLVFLKPDFGAVAGSEKHPVSIMVRIDRVNSSEPSSATQEQLAAESQQFIAGLDLKNVSLAFQ